MFKMSKLKTIGYLKDQLSDKIGIKPAEFNIKRQNVSALFKNPDATLAAAGLTSGCLMQVVLGEP